MIQDSNGAPLGKYAGRDLGETSQTLAIIKSFLRALQKNQKNEEEPQMSQNGKTNLVYLEGDLISDPREYAGKEVSALLDVGMKSAIQIKVSKDDVELKAKLLRFGERDHMRVVAMLEPWGQKQEDGKWKNGMTIRITQIDSEPPLKKQIVQTTIVKNESKGGRPW